MKKSPRKKEPLIQMIGRIRKSQYDFVLSLREEETMSWNLREAIDLAILAKKHLDAGGKFK